MSGGLTPWIVERYLQRASVHEETAPDHQGSAGAGLAGSAQRGMGAQEHVKHPL